VSVARHKVQSTPIGNDTGSEWCLAVSLEQRDAVSRRHAQRVPVPMVWRVSIRDCHEE
jgi:hypothetical protein